MTNPFEKFLQKRSERKVLQGMPWIDSSSGQDAKLPIQQESHVDDNNLGVESKPSPELRDLYRIETKESDTIPEPPKEPVTPQENPPTDSLETVNEITQDDPYKDPKNFGI